MDSALADADALLAVRRVSQLAGDELRSPFFWAFKSSRYEQWSLTGFVAAGGCPVQEELMPGARRGPMAVLMVGGGWRGCQPVPAMPSCPHK